MVLFIGGKCKLACSKYGLKVILIIARFEEVEWWHWTHVGAARPDKVNEFTLGLLSID